MRGLLLLITVFFSIQCVYANDLDDHKQEIDQWMIEMMRGSRSVGGALVLQRFGDAMYIVVNPFTWEAELKDTSYKKIVVPKGFVTDLTSVPPVFWSLLPRDGDYVYAAVAHDYLYWTQERDRAEADNILDVIMQEFCIGWPTRKSIYTAVDLVGNSAWKKNKQLKGSGESRYLKKFPQNPKTTWSSWKKEKEHFHDQPLTESHGQMPPPISSPSSC